MDPTDLARCADLFDAVREVLTDRADAMSEVVRADRRLAVLTGDIASFLRGSGLSQPLGALSAIHLASADLLGDLSASRSEVLEETREGVLDLGESGLGRLGDSG